MVTRTFPFTGWLALNSWAGYSLQRVSVVGETRQRYRIVGVLKSTRLGGQKRIAKGESALVPKYAITTENPHVRPNELFTT